MVARERCSAMTIPAAALLPTAFIPIGREGSAAPMTVRRDSGGGASVASRLDGAERLCAGGRVSAVGTTARCNAIGGAAVTGTRAGLRDSRGTIAAAPPSLAFRACDSAAIEKLEPPPIRRGVADASRLSLPAHTKSASLTALRGEEAPDSAVAAATWVDGTSC